MNSMITGAGLFRFDTGHVAVLNDYGVPERPQAIDEQTPEPFRSVLEQIFGAGGQRNSDHFTFADAATDHCIHYFLPFWRLQQRAVTRPASNQSLYRRQDV